MRAYYRKFIKPLVLRVFSQSLLTAIGGEWHLFLVRRKLPSLKRFYSNQKDLLVNFGAGSSGQPGWVNVDGFQQPGVNCLLDGRTPMPFADGSVRGFYSEHFFEHLSYPVDGGNFLRECYRVMKPGAVIRIIVPNAEAYMHAYCQPGWDALSRTRPLDSKLHDPYGRNYSTKMELINEVFRQAEEHKFAYDYETLEKLLHDAGFDRVIRSSFGSSLNSELLLDLPYRESESLYVEAVR